MIFTNSALRDMFITFDTISSSHTILAEWNMNKYQQIANIGIYKEPQDGYADNYSSTNAGSLYVDGNPIYIYDDGETKETDREQYLSSLASVFESDRPDPGIVLLQNVVGALIANDAGDLRVSNMRERNARFYPASKDRKYEYFNSGRYLDFAVVQNQTSFVPTTQQKPGISDAFGNILYANPFVVYEDPFPCNKIVIKAQRYSSYPITFSIDILLNESNAWTEIYSKNSDINDFIDGILEIYYDNGSWSTTEKNISNLDEIGSPSTQAVLLRGIRLRVEKMKEVQAITSLGTVKRYASSLEVIEISPRVQADLSSYTTAFSVNSSLGDSEFGLPVGRLVTSNGNITLSNESKNFLISGSISNYKMMSPDVEFRFYQNITNGTVADRIPLKVMYSDSWDVNEDFSANVSLSDKMKLLQEMNVMDMALTSKNGIPLSAAVLLILDNAGVTGFEFKKSSISTDANDPEDVKIKSFFCNKEKTVTQVLEELSIATQCAMFFDAENKLNIITKERMTERAVKERSHSSTSGSTDFWLVYDEKYSGQSEYDFISNYKANVVGSNEQKIDPVTDGTVTYHSYGVTKAAGAFLLERVMKDAIPDELLEDIPANSIIGADYDYTTKVLWSAPQDNDAVLGAANLQEKLGLLRVKDTFASVNIVADNEDEAIRKMCTNAFNRINQNPERIESLVIRLDRNDAFLFPDYSSYVMVDNEIIKYRGIVYFISGDNARTPYYEVLFSREELNEKIISFSSRPRPSILPVGLVVDVKFKVKSKTDKGYEYRIVGDGRAKMNTTIQAHEPFNEKSIWSPYENKFSFTIGKKEKRYKAEGELKTTTQYNFANDFKKLKVRTGIPKSSLVTRLGYLKISGPKGSRLDKAAIDLYTASGSTASIGAIDKEVDKLIPGTGSASFDPFVNLFGERYVYGQKVDLGFNPNVIGTQMRLYAGRRETKNDAYLASTDSSIAGIGFGLKFTENDGIKVIKSGYFLEVESAGNAKNLSTENSNAQNIRFYKIQVDDKGVIVPKVLATGRGKAFTTLNVESFVLKDESSMGDPVFDLEIRIDVNQKNAKIDIYYANQKVNDEPIIEKIKDDNSFWNNNNKNIFVFVRNDSQAIYQYLYAASKPIGSIESDAYFAIQDKFYNKELEKFQGTKPSENAQNLFKMGQTKLYFNDFARLVRQVKVYEPRFSSPAISSRLIDVSAVNPLYMIKEQRFNAFGGKIVVVNTAPFAIGLGPQNNLPLYVYGLQLEELSSGKITMSNFYDRVNNPDEKIQLEINKSLYGEKTFNIDNIFIQDSQQANKLMKWIIENCSSQRMQISVEIIANPLIELGDKVKIFSFDRGYIEDNENFGRKTFVITDIVYNLDGTGPKMNLSLTEVGV